METPPRSVPGYLFQRTHPNFDVHEFSLARGASGPDFPICCPGHPLANFVLNYIAMVPAANLIGFAGIHLSRHCSLAAGAMVKTMLSAAMEIIMFIVLPKNDTNGTLVVVIQAAILGSMLCNLLLFTGLIFFVGGINHSEQSFHVAITEAGSGLLLLSGLGLLIPSVFYPVLENKANVSPESTLTDLQRYVTDISRGTSVILLFGFFM